MKCLNICIEKRDLLAWFHDSHLIKWATLNTGQTGMLEFLF